MKNNTPSANQPLRFLVMAIVITLLRGSVNLGFSQPAIQWQQSFGGTNNDQPASTVRQQTPDGGSITIGLSSSNDGDVSGHHGTLSQSDIWILKLDSLGNVDWQQSYGGTSQEQSGDIIINSDGGYTFCGQTQSNDGDVSGNNGYSDCWVVKLDVNGTILWQHCYGSAGNDFASSIQQTPDGGYIVLGNTDSVGGDVSGWHGGRDLWLFKIDSIGTLLWQKCLGGSLSEQCEDNGLLLAQDGGFYITSNTNSSDGNVSFNNGMSDFWLVKTDSSGNIEWEHTFGGSGGEGLPAFSMTSDNGILLAGSTGSPVSGDVTFRYSGTGGDGWIVKTDSMGVKQWVKTLGGTGSEFFGSSIQTNDGGYLLQGLTFSNDFDVSGNHGIADSWLVKTDSVGTLQWQRCFGGSSFDAGCDMLLTTDGGLLMSNFSGSNDGDVSGHHGVTMVYDIWIVKLSPLSLGVEESTPEITSFSVFPNPVSSSAEIIFDLERETVISLSISDINGKRVKQIYSGKLSKGNHVFEWEPDGEIQGGIYLINITGDEFSVTRKITSVK